jgi:hypothetical protein
MSEIFYFLQAKPEAANAIAAIAAVFVSFISLLLALWALAVQRRHNFYSVRPLASIGRADYENRISVKLHNNGVGPLIIKKLSVSDGKNTKDSVIDWMPVLPADISWDTFTKELEKRTLAPGGDITLLELSGDPADPNFRKARDLCREVLSMLTVELGYLDIYNRQMPTARGSLSWFGRHASTPPIA